MTLVTNSPPIINVTKLLHLTLAFLIKCEENPEGLSYLSLNLALFAQLVYIEEANRFNRSGINKSYFFDK